MNDLNHGNVVVVGYRVHSGYVDIPMAVIISAYGFYLKLLIMLTNEMNVFTEILIRSSAVVLIIIVDEVTVEDMDMVTAMAIVEIDYVHVVNVAVVGSVGRTEQRHQSVKHVEKEDHFIDVIVIDTDEQNVTELVTKIIAVNCTVEVTGIVR